MTDSTGQNISKRFRRFLLIRCRTAGTNGRFIGPEWARLAINAVFASNSMFIHWKA